LFYDAIEMTDVAGKARLRHYAAGGSERPLPGFWTPADIYGDQVAETGAGTVRVPLEIVGDPLGALVPEYEIHGMHHRLKVIVPSTARDGTDLPTRKLQEVATQIKQLLHDVTGGSTSHEGQGSWADPIGGIVHERVTAIETYSADPVPADVLRQIVTLILDDLEQDAAALVVGDEMVHVERR
jgi:hypothetical protein